MIWLRPWVPAVLIPLGPLFFRAIIIVARAVASGTDVPNSWRTIGLLAFGVAWEV